VQIAQELAGALEAGDAQRFADSLAEFDSMTRLDAWKTGILLKVNSFWRDEHWQGKFCRCAQKLQGVLRMDGWKTGILLRVIACPCSLQSLTISGAGWQHSPTAANPEVFQAAPSGRSSVVLHTTSLAAARSGRPDAPRLQIVHECAAGQKTHRGGRSR